MIGLSVHYMSLILNQMLSALQKIVLGWN